MNIKEAREVFRNSIDGRRGYGDGLAEGYIEGYEAREAEIADLRAEVYEWLCDKCRTVYPGPPQKGFACVQCPKCGGNTGPRNWIELRSERERVKALVEALRPLDIENSVSLTSHHASGGSLTIGSNLMQALRDALASFKAKQEKE